MATCWRFPASAFDTDAVWSPERYSPERNQHRGLSTNAVPLTEIARLRKDTFNPQGRGEGSSFIILDTTHAYEGRVQFRGQVVSADGIGSVKRPVRPGDVIVSRLRTYLRQIALVDQEAIPDFSGQVLCSTEFYVLESIEGMDISFLVPFLLSDPVQKIFSAAEEGGHHPRVPSDVLMQLLIPHAVVEQRDEFSARVRENIRLIRAGERVMTHLHADIGKAMCADVQSLRAA